MSRSRPGLTTTSSTAASSRRCVKRVHGKDKLHVGAQADDEPLKENHARLSGKSSATESSLDVLPAIISVHGAAAAGLIEIPESEENNGRRAAALRRQPDTRPPHHRAAALKTRQQAAWSSRRSRRSLARHCRSSGSSCARLWTSAAAKRRRGCWERHGDLGGAWYVGVLLPRPTTCRPCKPAGTGSG